MGEIKKLLLIQPHSDDILFSACHALFLPDFEVEVLTVEKDPKRAEEDRRLYDFLNIPVHHLDLDFTDTSYYHHFKERAMKNVTDTNAYITLNNFFGKDLLMEIEDALIEWVTSFQRKHKGWEILSPLGIGHPFHLFVRDKLESLASTMYYYREFPHSYKRRSLPQVAEMEENGYCMYKSFSTDDWGETKWELAAKFYRSQSSLLWYEQGYIKKQLPEEVWINKDNIMPF